MKRGDVVIASAMGGFGSKPRPHIVVQSNLIVSSRIVLVGCTSSAPDDRPSIWPRLLPTPTNGLQRISDVMVDNLVTAYRSNVAQISGRLSKEELDDVDAALMIVLGLVGEQ